MKCTAHTHTKYYCPINAPFPGYHNHNAILPEKKKLQDILASYPSLSPHIHPFLYISIDTSLVHAFITSHLDVHSVFIKALTICWAGCRIQTCVILKILQIIMIW